MCVFFDMYKLLEIIMKLFSQKTRFLKFIGAWFRLFVYAEPRLFQQSHWQICAEFRLQRVGYASHTCSGDAVWWTGKGSQQKNVQLIY